MLDSWLAAADIHPLAVISFGQPLSVRCSCPLIALDLPQLDGPSMVEVWSSDQPVRTQQVNGLTMAMSGNLLMGSICVDVQPNLSLETTACAAYRQLLRQLRGSATPTSGAYGITFLTSTKTGRVSSGIDNSASDGTRR